MDLLADARWHCLSVEAGSVTDPALLPTDGWLPATVPGTAASAVRDSKGTAAARDCDPDAFDWWFVTEVDATGRGPWRLRFDGVATFARVWVDGREVASSESMFRPFEVVLEQMSSTVRVAVLCASVTAALWTRRPRGRWRSSMVTAQGLRWIRTSMLGRAPVFAGAPAPVGPWRPVRLLDSGEPTVVERTIRTRPDGHVGIDLLVHGAYGSEVSVSVGDTTVAGTVIDEPGGLGRVRVDAQVPDVRLWWPHTHGVPHLYPVTVEFGDTRIDLGRVGFRVVEVDREGDGFALRLNGNEVFCRGVVWTPTDPIGLTDPEGVRRTLELCVDAGINMIRIPGTMVYETDEFFSYCAESGIMVWQDMMLSTTDPPDDPHFRSLLEDEARALLRRVSGNPAAVVLCGGNETEQQPAMLGLGPVAIPALDDWLPAVVEDEAPGCAWVSSSPSANPGTGALPIAVGSGVSHYFGVGGYRRPAADVRAAGVRFASECLAFSIPPGDSAIEKEFGSLAVAGHHPAWKAAVPRDHGASWDFEDVRDHYVRNVFGVEPSEVRWSDPARYLDLGRAAICEMFGEVLGYWRRSDSGCGGALILASRDLQPGPGWGVLDHSGRPKAPWWVLSRVFAPVTVLLTDDGLDGLRIDVVNDTAESVDLTLQLQAHTPSGAAPVDVGIPLRLDPRSTRALRWAEATGGFVDVNHVYRFGVRSFDTATARLLDENGCVVAESVHLVGGPARAPERSVGLVATAREADGGWLVDVRTETVAQYVRLDVTGGHVTDSWFHLPPGCSRTVFVRSDGSATLTGRVGALNSATSVPIVHE